VSDPAAPSPSAAARAPRELLLLLTLAAMQFTHVLDFMIMMPLGPQFMRILALDPQHFAFLVSAYTFAAAASGFVAAFWVDRFGRKRALLTMYTGFIVATGLCGLAPNYPLLLLARIIAGVFGGIIGALIMTIVADVLPYSRRARRTALVASAFSLAAVLGVPLGSGSPRGIRGGCCSCAAGLSVAVGAPAWQALLPDAHVPRRAAVRWPNCAPCCVRNHLTSFAFIVALMLSIFRWCCSSRPIVANGHCQRGPADHLFRRRTDHTFAAQVIVSCDRFESAFTVVALLSLFRSS
jgi:predicted MFS family arabinose efflux permease